MRKYVKKNADKVKKSGAAKKGMMNITKKNPRKEKENVKRKEKRKNYSSGALQLAMKAFREGVPIRKAADTFGVPAATIFRKCTNPDKIDCRSGPPTVLSDIEEQEIVDWALYRSQRGFPITKSDLLDSVQSYIIKLGKSNPFTENRPGRHWFEGFCKRHPRLTIRTAQHLTLVRASVTEEDLRKWFHEIGGYLESKHLLQINPRRVFNCDETNIQLCPKPEKVLAHKGARSVYKIVDANEKESVTTLFMYSADGTRAPPLVIYPYKGSVPKRVIENFPSSWGIGISESGWMTIETFYEYITNVFYPWLLTENIEFPVIIYLDGHSSYVTMPLVSFCRAKNIELISLFPNATHIMQPLDVALFHPFKDIWKKVVPKWKTENNVLRLKREQFPAVLKMALNCFKEESNIVRSGFRACGLMPFNPDAIDYNILNKKKHNTDSIQNQPQINQQLEENQQQLPTTNTANDKENFLKMFEKTLPSELFQEFQNAQSIGTWTGSIEKKGLFDYWIGIKQTDNELSVKVKPTIKSIENINHKIVVVQIQSSSEDTEPSKSIEQYSDQSLESQVYDMIALGNPVAENITQNEHIVPLQDENIFNIVSNNTDNLASDSSMPLHSVACSP